MNNTVNENRWGCVMYKGGGGSGIMGVEPWRCHGLLLVWGWVLFKWGIIWIFENRMRVGGFIFVTFIMEG